MLIPAGTGAQAAQTVSAGTVRQVLPNMIGANTITRDQLSNIDPWSSSQSLAELVKTGMTVMRYPGGTYGNYFDWNEGRPYDKTTATHRYLPEQTKTATDALQFDPRTPVELAAAGFPEANGRATTIPGLQYQYFSKPKVHLTSRYDNLFPSASVK